MDNFGILRMNMEYQDIWDAALLRIKTFVPGTTFNLFFKDTMITGIDQEGDDFVVRVGAKNKIVETQFEKHQSRILQVLVEIMDMPCRMEVERLDLKEGLSETKEGSPLTIPIDNTLDKQRVDITREKAVDGGKKVEEKEVGEKVTISPTLSPDPSSRVKNELQERLRKIKQSRFQKNEGGEQEKKAIETKNKGFNDSPLFNPETQNILERQMQGARIKRSIQKAYLNREYTFENFAVSPTNEVAFAGATAVAKTPGTTYNPFFIYGDVGVGKTHLMQAVGIRMIENNPDITMVYCIGEQFTNEIIEAIQTKKTPHFRAKYRKVGALLIDDIQFIAGKDFVQEEFFHTFNAIKAGGGQVIMTADKPPHEISLLEDRLRSRFEEGLAIDVQQPNFELRTAILLIKSKQMGLNLQMDNAQTIAQNITSTRKLEGFLKNLYAASSARGNVITREIVLDILNKRKQEGELSEEKRPFVRPREVIKVICKHYSVSETQLYGPRRSRPIVTPRQYAMYLLKSDLKLPLQEIGRIFGGRDHTTVMHAVEKVGKIVSESEVMQQEFSTLRKQIYG